MPRLRSLRSLGVSVLVASWLGACASSPRARVAAAVERGDVEPALAAYEAYRSTEGSDLDLLGRVAALLLMHEVLEGDDARRRAALLQLSLAGTRGQPILRALGDAAGRGPARLGALSALARRGDEEARVVLRALADTDDPEVFVAAVLGMDPELDRGLLLSRMDADEAAVRAAVATALGPAAEVREVREALAARARIDPDASVRAAAVRSLGSGGPGAVEALRERLGDPSSSVRLAAVGAMMRADVAQARRALAPLLEVAPSPSGVEAARLLAEDTEDGGSGRDARAFLRRALASDDAGLRAQAGVALTGLSAAAESPLAAVREALSRERDPTVRLSLARALWRRDRPTATAALERLLDEDRDGLPCVQAAAMLSGEGHARGREILRAVLLGRGGSLVRRTAARALAREAMAPESVRSSLRDDDAEVRIYAAGGILAAAAAG